LVVVINILNESIIFLLFYFSIPFSFCWRKLYYKRSLIFLP